MENFGFTLRRTTPDQKAGQHASLGAAIGAATQFAGHQGLHIAGQLALQEVLCIRARHFQHCMLGQGAKLA